MRPASFSRRNGNARPPKFDPPPVQPTMRSGVWSISANCSSVSSPMIVWCRRTWLRTLPRAYLTAGSAAATSTASLIAIPRDPGCRGSLPGSSGRPGELRRRAVHRRPERLHHQPPVRLLVVGGADLPDLDVHAEECAGEGQCRSPLPGSGLRRQLPDAVLGVVERLRDGGVRLVRARRRDPLVLVVDLRRRSERLLQPVRAVQRRRPPQPVHVEHLAGDVDVPFRRHLLEDEVHREERREIVGPTGCRVPGCSGGGGGLGRSATRLYHCVGIRDSSSRILVGTSGTPHSFSRSQRRAPRAGRRAAGCHRHAAMSPPGRRRTDEAQATFGEEAALGLEDEPDQPLTVERGDVDEAHPDGPAGLVPDHRHHGRRQLAPR